MKDIEEYLQYRIGKYSFFFEDLNSEFTYGYNENVQMTAAGCIKLPIAVSIIKCIERGTLNFFTRFPIDENDKVCGKGILHEFNNREYTLFELLLAMLIQSDNTAANKLIKIAGMDTINKDIKAMGLKNTVLNTMTSDEDTENDEIENVTTAFDLSQIWKMLEENKFLNKKNSKMIIDILTRQQIRNKLSLYIPDNLKMEISSKSGDNRGVENDTALVHLSKGNFIFTVLSKDIPNSVYGTVTLAKCGKRMWDNVMNNWN